MSRRKVTGPATHAFHAEIKKGGVLWKHVTRCMRKVDPVYTTTEHRLITCLVCRALPSVIR